MASRMLQGSGLSFLELRCLSASSRPNSLSRPLAVELISRGCARSFGVHPAPL